VEAAEEKFHSGEHGRRTCAREPQGTVGPKAKFLLSSAGTRAPEACRRSSPQGLPVDMDVDSRSKALTLRFRLTTSCESICYLATAAFQMRACL
jgi:hypothetical protein